MEFQNSADLLSIWQMLEPIMRQSFTGPEQAYELWFNKMQLAYLDGEQATFVCENEMKRQIITQRYASYLGDCLGTLLGYTPKVVIECDPSLAPVIPDDGSVISPLKIVKERRKGRDNSQNTPDAQDKSDNPDKPDQSANPDQSAKSDSSPADEKPEPVPSAAGQPEQKDEPLFYFDPSAVKPLPEDGSMPSLSSLGIIITDAPTPEDIRQESAKKIFETIEAGYRAAGRGIDFAESSAMLREEKSDAESSSERRLAYNDEYTFENFIVGTSNRFAHAAALNVADNLGMKINPLFIWGPSGLGKTHLMYAIANRALKRDPDMKVIYVKGEEFVNQMVEAIMKNKNREFRKKFRSADMLLIDDVQFIAGKEATQMEFFHTFDALYEDKKQIILTSDRPPRELTSLEERIRSRFEAGLLADIQPPDYELRLAILRGKIRQNQIDVPMEVIDFLAQNLQENIRQLEGVIKKLAMANLLTGDPVDMEMVLKTVPEYLREAEPVSDTVDRIISVVAKHYSVTVDDIMGSSRKKEIKTARNVAMYIVRSVTGISLPQIGAIFKRDHSTVHSNITGVEEELTSDPVLEATITEITKEIKR